jgi:hypothetical protein
VPRLAKFARYFELRHGYRAGDGGLLRQALAICGQRVGAASKHERIRRFAVAGSGHSGVEPLRL